MKGKKREGFGDRKRGEKLRSEGFKTFRRNEKKILGAKKKRGEQPKRKDIQ